MLAHENSLSLRSLLICGDNGIGEKCFRFLEEISRQRPIEFLGATREVSEKPSLVPNLGKRLARDTLDILNLLNSFRERAASLTEDSNSKGLSDLVKDIAAEQVDDAIERDKILDHLLSIISSTECSTIGGLISAVSTASERFEQEKDKVNIMTMHKAKGLTA